MSADARSRPTAKTILRITTRAIIYQGECAMNSNELIAANKPDIALLINLWRAIHSTEASPSPIVADERTLELGAAFVAHLARTFGTPALASDMLKERAARLGVNIVHPNIEPMEFMLRQPPRIISTCVSVNGDWICITVVPPREAVGVAKGGLVDT
jgi:hypothetical protein